MANGEGWHHFQDQVRRTYTSVVKIITEVVSVMIPIAHASRGENMKMIILILSVFLVGCSKPIDQTVDGHGIWSVKEAGRLFRIKFDGHIYICRDNGHLGGICHDPDCSCLKR